jgi:hypothetical protein
MTLVTSSEATLPITPLLSSLSYEVQLESKVRRKGLGKFLIQILQLMANR